MLLPLSGGAPDIAIHGTHQPLNRDGMTDMGIDMLFLPTLPGFPGTPDIDGRASASLVAPPLPIAGVPGLELTAAAITLQPIDWASNAVAVEFVP